MNQTDKGLQTAVLGGGCFWCTEAVLSGLRGVHKVEPGYSGGDLQHPTYEQVCNQDTGHIEVVRVSFDPTELPFAVLLQVFFATHDPTTLNRQGADVGPQYASVVFAQTDQQHEDAQAVIAHVQTLLDQPVVTQLRDAQTFWPAEPEHYAYYQRHPQQGYCQFVIAPKMAHLRQHFAPLLAG